MRIFNDHSRLSLAASRVFVRSAAQAISERGRFLAALSGGTTPIALYSLLARAALDWANIHLFWGDERCVPVGDPGNNYGQALQTLLGQVPLAEQNIHRIRSELPPIEAARDYAQLLKRFADPPLEWPRFDLVLLGLGEDGHTASLFPGSPVDAREPVMAVTGDYQGRPADRITLTPLVFNSARQIIFLVSGQSKSGILASVFKGGQHPDDWPAQRIRPTDGRITWMVDAQAASRL
jgi:6-phosphogluconolactonase